MFLKLMTTKIKSKPAYDCTMFASPKTKTAVQWNVHGRVQLRSPPQRSLPLRAGVEIFFLRKRRGGDAWVFHQCTRQFNLSQRGKKTQISINNGSVPSGAPGEAESEPARAATPGPPVTLHPLIKEPVFLRRGYNVSCVQPVHYAPPLPSSSCCRTVTHGRFFTTLQFLQLNHINVTAWRETKVEFSSKLSPCSECKFVTFVLRFVRLKMFRFYFSS